MRALPAAPEVAAAYDEGDFHPHLFYGDYLIDHAGDDRLVQAVPAAARKRLA